MSGPPPRRRPTEHIDEQYANLDTRSAQDIITALTLDQHHAVQAVLVAAPDLARAAHAIAEQLVRGGRLFYAGAGTSGRLAQLDAYELFPAFAFPMDRTIALLAGAGLPTLAEREAAEDAEASGAQDLLAHAPTPHDVLLAAAASGSTPYTVGAVRAARQRGTMSVALANNPDSALLTEADHPILLATGAEVIAGNTRLKAGTAQKIALNALSTTVMIRLGKVYRNLMVELQVTNDKLRQRAVQLVIAATAVSEADAVAALHACNWNAKAAMLTVQCGIDADAAHALLARHPSVRDALAAHGRALGVPLGPPG